MGFAYGAQPCQDPMGNGHHQSCGLPMAYGLPMASPWTMAMPQAHGLRPPLEPWDAASLWTVAIPWSHGLRPNLPLPGHLAGPPRRACLPGARIVPPPPPPPRDPHPPSTLGSELGQSEAEKAQRLSRGETKRVSKWHGALCPMAAPGSANHDTSWHSKRPPLRTCRRLPAKASRLGEGGPLQWRRPRRHRPPDLYQAGPARPGLGTGPVDQRNACFDHIWARPSQTGRSSLKCGFGRMQDRRGQACVDIIHD